MVKVDEWDGVVRGIQTMPFERCESASGAAERPRFSSYWGSKKPVLATGWGVQYNRTRNLEL